MSIFFSGNQKYMSAECYYDAQCKCAGVLNFVMLNHEETLQRILELWQIIADRVFRKQGLEGELRVI